MADIPEIHDVQDQAAKPVARLTKPELAMLAEAEAQIALPGIYAARKNDCYWTHPLPLGEGWVRELAAHT